MIMQKIGVLNFGLGNVNSIINIIYKIGFDAHEIKEEKDLKGVTKLIFPGVGHFGKAMGIINAQKNLLKELNNLVLCEKIPILGICLGMQIMTSFSEEGNCEGLNWIKASVRPFKGKLKPSSKIPHMGWNNLVDKKETSILTTEENDQRFYFVHSYYVDEISSALITSNTTHGDFKFCSSFQKENLYGVQFHPEKSHKYGLNLFKKFLGDKNA